MKRRCAASALVLVASLVASLFTASPAFAQLPQPRLYAVSPAGGQTGATFDLTLSSAAENEDVRMLLFSHPGITAKAKTDDGGGILKTPRAVANVFTVTIGKDVPTGLYEVRYVSALGISNSRAFIVGDLPEAVDTSSNGDPTKATPLAVGSVVNGAADARGVDHFKVSLKKGQRVIVDCKAETIDSRMSAVLKLLDASGSRELDRSFMLSGFEPMLDVTAEADGDYIVAVHDFTFGGGPQHFYRLTVRGGPYIDYIFPPSGLAGTKGKFTLFGRNLPGGGKSGEVASDGTPLEKLDVEIDIPADASANPMDDGMLLPVEASMDAILYRLASPQGVSNTVRVGIARAPISIESEPNDDPSKSTRVAPPCEIVGRFMPRSDRDWISFEAKAGQVFWIEVFSQRLGMVSDPSLVIQQVKKNEKGEETNKDIVVAEDTPGVTDGRFSTNSEDPSLRFAVPEDGVYRILVRDNFSMGKADPRRIFRLSILPESAQPAATNVASPDFRLIAAPNAVIGDKANKQNYEPGGIALRRGGSEEVMLLMVRRGGFAGEVDVTVEGLPAGVTCAPTVIPAGSNSVSLVFRGAPDSPFGAGMIRILGKAKIGDKDVVREARGGQIVWGPQQDKARGWSRIAAGIALSVTDAETVPFTVSFGETKVHDTTKGGKFNVPIKVDRRDNFKGPIKVKGNAAATAMLTAKEITIAADKNEGTLECEVKGTAAPQGYTVLVEAESQISYARTPKAVDALNAQKKELEEMAKAVASDKDKSKKIADMLKTIDADIKKMTEMAKPKNVNLTQPVGTVVARVTEPPKPEKKDEKKDEKKK